ncbi:hypothetical protein B0T11DRAFT_314911 [Plectosphaerella cucumerina]|uniref:NmrA-like domain-containing protein n=1 Tax=Plectosphaerella cucumerina TaxID=40658 RepID=A0A8K0X986_9PEZI|nr:hypothetical protein B0T11DRAFT_314911 [Plectosphaerella cucumerina]
MSTSKLLVVFGATGNQGGSVVDQFLSQAGWQIRALTRDPSSAKAQALASRGAEVAHVDLDKPDTLPAALKGANAVFTQVIDAVAKVPTLERFILSSLSNSAKWSNGKYTHVHHFDSKAKAAEYAQDTYPELWKKTSIFQAGFFLTNYVGMMAPIKNGDGVVRFVGYLEQDVKVPLIAAEEDTGHFVRELIVTEAAGKNLIAYRAWLTVKEIAESFSRATGMKAEAVTLPKGHFPPEMPEEMRLELGDNFACINEFGYEARNDPTVIHPQQLQSPPRLATVEEYFKNLDWSKVL